MNRRSFMQSILAAGVAPYVCTTAGVLMPGRGIFVPRAYIVYTENGIDWIALDSMLHIKHGRLIESGSVVVGPNQGFYHDGDLELGKDVGMTFIGDDIKLRIKGHFTNNGSVAVTT